MLLIKQGLQNKIVAHELNLAEATVKYHLRNIYKKLGVNNRVQALAAADPALNAETEKSS
jgi:LuxR family maltose regulon positive regulatory protein